MGHSPCNIVNTIVYYYIHIYLQDGNGNFHLDLSYLIGRVHCSILFRFIWLRPPDDNSGVIIEGIKVILIIIDISRVQGIGKYHQGCHYGACRTTQTDEVLQQQPGISSLTNLVVYIESVTKHVDS